MNNTAPVKNKGVSILYSILYMGTIAGRIIKMGATKRNFSVFLSLSRMSRFHAGMQSNVYSKMLCAQKGR